MKYTFVVCFMALFVHFGIAQNIKLGIITDFNDDSPEIQFFFGKIKDGIQQTVGTSKTVTLESQNILSSDWDIQKAKDQYSKLQNSVDMIILIGAVSIKGATDYGTFSKPTIGLGVFNTEIQGIPLTDKNTSGVQNFSYVLTSNDMFYELKEFKRIVGYDQLTILLYEKTSETFDQEKGLQQIELIKDSLQTKINFLPIGEDIAGSLSKLKEETDAVYLALPYELEPSEIKQIAEELKKRKIPSFSMSQYHVELGILGSVAEDNDIEQIIRKIGIMADEAINGINLANMSVLLNHKSELYLNVKTAEAIGFSPTFDVIFTANLINKEEENTGKQYTINEIIDIAVQENLKIKISQQDVLLAARNTQEAKSNFLPDASVSGTGVVIDDTRANALFGQSERTITASGKVQQLIYSESAVANIKIQDYLRQAKQHAREQEVLNVILDSYSGYFSILQAKTNRSILEENLEVSETNLELAKLRVSLGASTSAEVYRWESEVAGAKQQLIQAESQLMIAKLQLNNLLNNKLNEEFEIKDTKLDDDIFNYFSDGTFSEDLNTPAKFQVLIDFLVDESKRIYPSKKQILANKGAIERQMVMNKRVFYTPTIALQGQYDKTLNRSGKASEAPPGQSFNNDQWNIGLSVSYPLFNKNQRYIALQKTKVQQDQVNLQIESLDRNLEIGVKAKAIQLISSTTNIHYSEVSSENARKNFELVQTNYKKGQTSIIQLIDAQRNAIRAKQQFALSIYQYLTAHIELENSIGFYTMLATPEQLEDYRNRFIEYKSNKQ